MQDDLTPLIGRVSHHAVTRYVQRIIGLPVLAEDAVVGSKRCAEIHAAAARQSVDDIRILILTPAVIMGIRLGANRIFSPPLIATLSKEEAVYVVTTIMAHGSASRYSPSAIAEGRPMPRRHDRRILDRADQ